MSLVSRNAGLQRRLMQYMGMTMELAPGLRPRVEQELSRLTGNSLPAPDALQGLKKPEHALVQKARQRALDSVRPQG